MTAPITQDVLTIPRKLPESARINIVGLTREQLREALIAAGTPERQAKMRVGQIWQWIYHWGLRDFAQMTNLAKDYRALLAEKFEIGLPEVVTRQISEDGTRKYLLRIAGGDVTVQGDIAVIDAFGGGGRSRLRRAHTEEGENRIHVCLDLSITVAETSEFNTGSNGFIITGII